MAKAAMVLFLGGSAFYLGINLWRVVSWLQGI